MTMLKTTKTETDFTSSVSVVNGIDTDAVHALIESVEAQPAQGIPIGASRVPGKVAHARLRKLTAS
jgi:hypothetical protein